MWNFKPLLCLGSSAVIRHTIDALRKAGIKDIVVATGHQSAVPERHFPPYLRSPSEERKEMP